MSAQLESLLSMSTEIGSNPALVQGPGGNTSAKLQVDGATVLWIKASGAWLSEARERPIFVPVHHQAVMDMIDAGDEKLPPESIAAGGPKGLRPSIETTLHALMPHRYVVHTHAVNTITIASMTNAEAELAPRLHGLSFAHVPYNRPGLPLTLRVREALAGRAVDVLVLGNHGLVVGADSAEGAAALTHDVESRLNVTAREVRTAPDVEALGAIQANGDWRMLADGVSHAVAFDPEALDIAQRGSLYPDHVIFLGHAIATNRTAGADSPAMVVPGAGVLLKRDCPPAADWMVHALSAVTTRLRNEDDIHYLGADDEAALLDWDAEKYRQHLARTAPA